MSEKLDLERLLKPFASVIAIISMAVYITLYVATIDKRVTVLEAHQIEIENRMNGLREWIRKDNTEQDQAQAQFHSDMTLQMNQMNDRIEKIYTILLDARDAKTQGLR